jgi:hypothetical protein
LSALRFLALVVAFAMLLPADALAYVGHEIVSLEADGRSLTMATKKTASPKSLPEKPALDRLLERYKTSELAEPFATMPLEELRAAVEAMIDASSLDRRGRALALLPYLRAVIQRSPHENEVLLGIEAFEKAWAHFKPRLRKSVTPPQYVFAEHLISQLDWALSLRLSESPPSWEELVGALSEMDDSIPYERWEEAVRAWLGERPSPRGRPANEQPPYHWHRVIHRLLTGKEDAIEAANFRDNLAKWRARRRAQIR